MALFRMAQSMAAGGSGVAKARNVRKHTLQAIAQENMAIIAHLEFLNYTQPRWCLGVDAGPHIKKLEA